MSAIQTVYSGLPKDKCKFIEGVRRKPQILIFRAQFIAVAGPMMEDVHLSRLTVSSMRIAERCGIAVLVMRKSHRTRQMDSVSQSRCSDILTKSRPRALQLTLHRGCGCLPSTLCLSLRKISELGNWLVD